MPADILPSCRNERFRPSYRKTNGAEVKSGFMGLLAAGGVRQDVRVVVYRTSVEHFAVIYPRKRITKPVGVVNLRNTSVQAESNNGFVVRQKGYDDTISAKFLCQEIEVTSWISAFTSRLTPQGLQTSLPVLIESEES